MVTVGELARNVRELRVDTQSDMSEIRATLQGLDERTRAGELSAKSQGERLGRVERDVREITLTLRSINKVAWTGLVLPLVSAVIAAGVATALH